MWGWEHSPSPSTTRLVPHTRAERTVQHRVTLRPSRRCFSRGGECNDEQPARHEAHEQLTRQVRDGNQELLVGPHGHAVYGSAVALCREVCQVRCGQRRILVECEWVLGVASRPAAAAVRALYFRCHFVCALVRILR